MRQSVRLLVVAISTLSAGGLGAQGLEEVLVTAQKRPQTLQEVPVAVAVMSNDFIFEQGIVDVQGLGEQVPSLTIAKTPYQPVINIRGMGSGGGTRTFEQSVAMYVDGVYAGRANQFLNALFDVERVEVVRGPQTVLFGVNAIAGGINIVNKAPGDELEGFVSTSYEFENESWLTEGAVTVPLADNLAVRLAGRKGFEGGFMTDTFTGDPVPETDYDMLRATVLWEPTDNLVVKFSAETSERETDGTSIQMISLSPLFQTLFPPSLEDGKRDFRSSGHPATPDRTFIESDNVTLNIDWQIGTHTLTSTSGYSQYEFAQDVTAGAVPLPAGPNRTEEEFDQFYQELRIASSGDNKLDYIVGAAYYRQNIDLHQGIDINLAAATGDPTLPRVGVRNGLAQETSSSAVFGQLTYNFTDNFRALLGARYSDVKKDADYVISTAAYGAPMAPGAYQLDPVSYFALSSPAFGWLQWFDPTNPGATMRPSQFSRSKSLTAFDPSLTLQWDINDQIATYATYSKGTKAGGYNDQEKSGIVPENGFGRDDFEYDEEEATNYEAGIKFSGSRWRANAAVFYTKFEDLQVSTFSENTVRTKNAAAVISKGIELDGRFLLTDSIEVGGYVTFLDSYYDDFPGVGCMTGPDPASPPPCDPFTSNGAGTATELAADIEGNIYVQWRYPAFPGTELTLRANAFYNDGYTLAADHDPIDYQDSYWKYGLYAQLASLDGRWQVSLRGENLDDEVVIIMGGDAALGSGHQGVTSPGRQLFLTARWNF